MVNNNKSFDLLKRNLIKNSFEFWLRQAEGLSQKSRYNYGNFLGGFLQVFAVCTKLPKFTHRYLFNIFYLYLVNTLLIL